MVVITGATKGIGLAIAKTFAAQKMDLAIISRNQKELDELAERLQSEHVVDVKAYAVDLSEKQAVRRLAQELTAAQTRIQALINNAGFFKAGQKIEEEDDGLLEKTLSVNLMAPYFLTQNLIPVFKKQAQGHIFNICSVASIKGFEGGASYAISKFALLGFSKVLREELKANKIKVTAVLPGATHTASWAGVDIDPARIMKPEDVAQAVWGAFALSENSVVEEILIRPQLGDL